MLYSFLTDVWDILRLRYKNPADYFYTPPVIFAVLLLLGVINAANASPLFGTSAAAVVFAVLVTVIKWLVLSRTMSFVLSRNGSPHLPLWGFVLASESLMIPTLLVFYVPQLTPFLLFWQIWTLWVQVVGLMRMGRVKIWTVFQGYLLYFCGIFIISTIMLSLFMMAGWLDMAELQQNLEAFMTTIRQAK